MTRRVNAHDGSASRDEVDLGLRHQWPPIAAQERRGRSSAGLCRTRKAWKDGELSRLSIAGQILKKDADTRRSPEGMSYNACELFRIGLSL